ncbi:MAG: alginate export family protein [Phycisphaeraceae bacterium]|nr:alginate export family protein [Phycisphaeraceae bacterium]
MFDRWLFALIVLLTCSSAVLAQSELERFERTLEQVQRDTRFRVSPDIPAEQRALIDYGGYATFSFLATDDNLQNTHILRQYDLNGYARVNFDNVHDFFVRVRTTYRDFNSGDAFDSNGDDWVEPTLDRATYHFDLRRAMQAYNGENIKGNFTLDGGRQLVHWANGLVLSDTLDGALLNFSYDTITLTALASVTRDSNTDIDPSRPGFDDDTHRGFYGGMLSWQVTPKHRPFIYGLVQDDNNDDEVLVTGAVSTRFRYDSFYIGFGSNGALTDQLLYGVEMAYQGGETLSNSFDSTFSQVTQTTDPISAFGADFRLDYLFTDQNHSRLSGELIIATGDTDRLVTDSTFGGNQPGSTDHAFNSFGLLNTGLAFAPPVSNIIITRVGASTFPLPQAKLFRRMQVGIDFLVFNKFNSSAPIDEATEDDSYLGFEPDLFVNWEITSDLSLALRYGAFFPGDAITTDHDVRHFFYTGVTFSF